MESVFVRAKKDTQYELVCKNGSSFMIDESALPLDARKVGIELFMSFCVAGAQATQDQRVHMLNYLLSPSGHSVS